MKLYIKDTVKVFRVQISQKGFKTEYVTFYDCTQQECIDQLQNIISSQNLSIFQKGYKTSLIVREGQYNSKAKSISFKGLNPKETLDVIVEHFKNKKL